MIKAESDFKPLPKAGAAESISGMASQQCISVLSQQYRVMGSEGLIQDPATKKTKRFHRDEKS